jgi:hypothetical protein
MWNSDAKQGVLLVQGDPGVELRILDADFQLKAQGTVHLRQALPPGVYTINWKSSRELHQEVVRLRAGQTRTVQPPVRSDAARHADALVGAAEALAPALQPSAAGAHEAEVMVLVDQAKTGATTLDLQLFTRDDIAMGSDSSDVRAGKPEDGSATVYDVPPAVYRLRYRSSSGETLDQSVPALAGRRTIVFMHAVVGAVIVSEGSELKTLEYAGADPSRTVIITLPRGGALAEAEETRHLAGLLLADLISRRTSLGEALLAQIEAADADPLLRIYAAASILQRLEDGRSPTLEQPTPAMGLSVTMRWKWLGRARRLLDLGEKEGLPADVEVAAWQAGAMRAGPRAGPMKALRTPPMLECCWGWAVKRSVIQPDTIPGSFSFRAAAIGGAGASPWLAWRTAAAKSAAPEPPASSSRVDLNALVHRVAAEGAKLLGSATAAAADPLARLSPEARSVVTRALQLTPQGPFSALLRHGLAQKVAQSIQVPAAALQVRAEQALQELRQASTSPPTEPSVETAPQPTRAPALARAVLVPDDPQKGRFGGKAEVDGFRLSADFDQSGADWVTIRLVVEGQPEAARGTVEFFLHDTFNPDHYVETFTNGRAELEVYAMGGFTVGVWIAEPGVELELDLAAIDGAPRIVREL